MTEATKSSKQEVKRWVTRWPYDLQPTFGSSTIDWTKVEVVPAADYDARGVLVLAQKAHIERLRAALEKYGRHLGDGTMGGQCEGEYGALGLGPCTCGLAEALRGEGSRDG